MIFMEIIQIEVITFFKGHVPNFNFTSYLINLSTLELFPGCRSSIAYDLKEAQPKWIYPS